MKDSQLSKKKVKPLKKEKKKIRWFKKKKSADQSEKPSKIHSGWSNNKAVKKPTGNSFFSVLKKYEFDLQLVIMPLILAVILACLNLVNNEALLQIEKMKLASSDAITVINPYPFVHTAELPELSAKAAIIIDVDSQVILFSKNPDVRFSMASTTKIMTALAALDYFQSNSLLTVQSTGAAGSVIGLQKGEQYYFEDLLYAILLPSANDAAITIAENYPGGIEAFILKMNDKAQFLHLTNTRFSDPTGLDDDGNFTTAKDMAHLASYAIKNNKFTEITATKQKVISPINNLSKQHVLHNLNKLLGINGVNGIKTGTTEGAGEVLVTSTIANGHTFIIVVMNSQDRFTDTTTLLNFITENVQYVVPSLPINK